MFAGVGGFSFLECGLGQLLQRSGLIPAGVLHRVEVVQGAPHLGGGHQQDVGGVYCAVHDGAGGIDGVEVGIGQGAEQGAGVILDGLHRAGDLRQLLGRDAVSLVAVAHIGRGGHGLLSHLPVVFLDQLAGVGDGGLGQVLDGGLQQRAGVKLYLLVFLAHFFFLPADSFLRVMSL